MSEHLQSPWLGLYPYEEANSGLFYGRENEIEELSGDIFNNFQTIVFGPSGTGKTSLLRAGIFPLARQKGMLPVYVRLIHNSRTTYTRQLIEVVLTELNAAGGEAEEVVPAIREDESLWEFFHRHRFWLHQGPVIPLLVIDQFEEIFTLAENSKDVNDFFNELADLLNNVFPDYIAAVHSGTLKESKEERALTNLSTIIENVDWGEGGKTENDYIEDSFFHFVLSLREDFLSKLEQYTLKIPLLKQNRFWLSPLNEEQAYEIILKAGGKLVTEEVAVEIIRKVTNNFSFKIDGVPEVTVEPAILSLFCNELNLKRIEDNLPCISTHLVRQYGDNIIRNFYERAMSLVSEKTAVYFENVLLTNKGFRKSVALSDALDDGVTLQEIDILQANRLIHLDKRNHAKWIEFTHDVLCRVAKKRRDDRVKLKTLEAEQVKNRELALLLEKRKKKNRWLLCLTLLLTFLLIFVYVGYQYLYVWEYTEYYEGHVKRYGWPTGIGKRLSEKEKGRTNVYVKLSRKGYWGNNKHFDQMETYNAYGKPSTNHSIGTYLVSTNEYLDDKRAQRFSRQLASVYLWKFVADPNGNVAQEIAYAEDGTVVYIFSISRGTDIEGRNDIARPYHASIGQGKEAKTTFIEKEKEKKINSMDHGGFVQAIGTYTDENGIPLKMRDNGANKVKIIYDSMGFEIRYFFYDSQGVAQTNYDGAYGQYYQYDRQSGVCISYNSLDPFGCAMNDACDNSGMRFFDFDNRGRWRRAESFDARGNLCKVNKGFAIVKREYDDDSGVCVTKYYDEKEQPAVSTEDRNAHRVKTLQDSKGNVIKIENRGTDGLLLHGDTSWAEIYMQYDVFGNQLLREFRNEKDQLVRTTQPGYYAKFEFNYDPSGKYLLSEHYWRNVADTALIVYTKKLYYDQNWKDTLVYTYDVEEENIYASVKKKYDDEGHLIQEAWYDREGAPILNEGYHQFVVNRERYGKDTLVVVERYLDTAGNLLYTEASEYAKDSAVYVNDRLVVYTKFDEQDEISSSHLYDFNEFGEMISQSVRGIFDYPVRWSLYDNVIYYKVRYYTDFTGNFYMKNFNEFDEPAYMVDEEGIPFDEMREVERFIQLFGRKYKISELSEDDKEVLKEYFPQAACLRVISRESAAYQCGIQDGDILIQYGNWSFSFDNYDQDLLRDELNRLQDTSKELTVVRHYPDKKESKRLNFTLPAGMSGLSIFFIPYKEYEKERLINCLEQTNE